MFSKHWQTEIITLNRYNTRFNNVEPNADNSFEVISSDELRKKLKENKFVFFSSPFDHFTPFRLAVPPQTTIAIEAPKDSFKEGENFGQIDIAIDRLPIFGPLYTIRISTRPLATGQGSQGYKKYAGLSAEQDRTLFTYLYEVKVTTETSRLRSGSPMLARYKQWKNRMVEALRDQLDDERIFERNKQTGCILTNGE
jgi:hypothetical protein